MANSSPPRCTWMWVGWGDILTRAPNLQNCVSPFLAARARKSSGVLPVLALMLSRYAWKDMVFSSCARVAHGADDPAEAARPRRDCQRGYTLTAASASGRREVVGP